MCLIVFAENFAKIKLLIRKIRRMTVYFILGAFVIAGCVAEQLLPRVLPGKAARIINRAVLFFNAAALSAVSAMRLNTGYDYAPYMRMMINAYDKTIGDPALFRYERGYFLLNKFSSFFMRHPQIIMAVMSILVSVLVCVALLKMSPLPSMGFMMYYLFGYYFNSMNFHRNLLAALVILCAYGFLRKRSFVRYAALVLLAASIHMSAFVMLPMYFILKIKFNAIAFAIYGALSAAFIYFCTPLMEYVTTYIYTAYNPATSPHMYMGIPAAYPLFLSVLFIVVFIYRKHLSHSGWNSVLISAAYLSFFFEFLGSRHSILGRFTMYFGIVTACVTVPMLFGVLVKKISAALKEKKTLRAYAGHIVSLGAVFASAAGFFVYAVLNNYNGVVPYNLTWSLFK